MPEERLQKLISQAGIASRRAAEQMILDGRVVVNGEIVSELGTKADLLRDHIKVDGQRLKPPKKLIYLALNKPTCIVTTLDDPQGRRTVVSLLKRVKERVYPVGRLDYHSEGLLLLTNDGDFANAIIQKRSKLVKTYVVKVTGTLTFEEEEKFRKGVVLSGQRTAPAGLKLIKEGDNPWYEVQLTEGRQNQIRMMFKHFDKLVEKLRRVKIGFLSLDIPPGEFRSLSPDEVAKFRRILKLDDPTATR